jgi:hypothetical protein
MNVTHSHTLYTRIPLSLGSATTTTHHNIAFDSCLYDTIIYSYYDTNGRGNLILADCLEDRVINSSDYVRPGPGPSESVVASGERRVVTRKLQQAMIPGPELVRVQHVQQVLGPGSALGQGLSSPTGTPAVNDQAIVG